VAEAGSGLDRARWVEARLNEMPKLAIFLYHVLLDTRILDVHRQHAFAALCYILEGGDIVPPSDPTGDGLDEVAFALRCCQELFVRIPAPALSVYEEMLHREGISLREIVREAPLQLAKLYAAVTFLYPNRVEARTPLYKNAVETGRLVEALRLFISSFKPARLTAERQAMMDAFLTRFALPK
jgi:hypothetical protein